MSVILSLGLRFEFKMNALLKNKFPELMRAYSIYNCSENQCESIVAFLSSQMMSSLIENR